MRCSLNLGVLLLLAACASTSRQTDEFLESAPTIPQQVTLQHVPFIEQSRDYCGPASLAMAMNSAGRSISMEEIGQQTFTPGKTGTLQSDMIGASRRNGLLALNLSSVPNLLTEVAAGQPVLVFQNLAFSWYPKWHYAVVVGYDLATREIILHTGPHAFHRMSLRRFEHSWKLGKYWGLVLQPPSKLSATADDLAHASAAAALERLGQTQEANEAYTAQLKRWPASLGALIGLGNLRYAARDWSGSIEALEEATRRHPNSSIAWHNLALAQRAARRMRAARNSATQALALAGSKETASAYRESLASLIRN